jgi:hypothetical protein
MDQGLSRRRRGAEESDTSSFDQDARIENDLRRLHLAQDNPQDFFLSLGLGADWPAESSKRFSIVVNGHEEKDGHTYYQIRCSLLNPDNNKSVSSWACEKRLCELRADIFEPVVESAGEAYEPMFYDVPFALRGGLPGTTDRLSQWLERLVICMNTGRLQGDICALIFYHFQTPSIGTSLADFCPPPPSLCAEATTHLKPPQMAMM